MDPVFSSGTSVLRIKNETDEMRKRQLPYVITFTGGYTAMVTVPGRPPLCFKCKCIGTLWKDCTPQGNTYSARAQSGSGLGGATNVDADVEAEHSVDGSDSGSGHGTGDVKGVDMAASEGTIGGEGGASGGEGEAGDVTGEQAQGTGGGSGCQQFGLSGYGVTQSTGSTILPNQEKRPADSGDDDEIQMTTDELGLLKLQQRLKGNT